MSDFQEKFHSMTDLFSGAAKSIMGAIDHFTFKMLVDGLKADDFEAVSGTIEQLESAVRATEITLDADVLAKLDEIFPGPGGEAPKAYAW